MRCEPTRVCEGIDEGVLKIARAHSQSVEPLLTRGERHTRVERGDGMCAELSLHIHQEVSLKDVLALLIFLSGFVSEFVFPS